VIGWLLSKLFKSKPVEGYRLIGIEERRQEEEIKSQILRKFRRRMKNGK
jgi:hypothetical protein